MKINFTNINESAIKILYHDMLKLQRYIVANLGSLRKFAEAREFLSKSNMYIEAVVKAKSSDELYNLRLKFSELCDKFRGTQN